jgi:ABC-type dipeptide/oligopeptide/nickel transport system permease subunit
VLRECQERLSRLLDFLFGFPQLVFMIALGIIVPGRAGAEN